MFSTQILEYVGDFPINQYWFQNFQLAIRTKWGGEVEGEGKGTGRMANGGVGWVAMVGGWPVSYK